ncbi:hypothetical protein E3Q08_02208 [Wallemia mellicola]|nr:hypothetical protein E3Q16_01741 [Wallemia mellicola]TIC43854.1 hypothetical protein E3Q08_02208 [Wallemia mellicola]
MKLLQPALIFGFAATVTALLIPSEFQLSRIMDNLFTGYSQKADSYNRASQLPTISDLLTLQRGSLFYDYVREVSQVERLLDNHATKLTVFAPTNKAIVNLHRRPHQVEHSGVESMRIWENAMTSSVRNWVESHIVRSSDLEINKTYDAFSQTKITLTERDGIKLVNGIKVLDIKTADNGELYVIEDVLRD